MYGCRICLQICLLFVDSKRNMACEVADDALLEMVQSIVPSLTNKLYKGLCGRIAVIGGCKE